MNLNLHTFRSGSARTVLMGILLPLFSGAAMAADPPADTSKLKSLEFSAVDSNRDGSIDSKEAAAVPELAKIFKTSDKDGNGKLSASEFLSATQSY
ncbi:MAG TPA: EF-hand domain-containing protein [Rhodocyclaceae bacterium]|nr:EF-hand domain-containing protein [Rhodocyclaceae bacterium]